MERCRSLGLMLVDGSSGGIREHARLFPGFQLRHWVSRPRREVCPKHDSARHLQLSRAICESSATFSPTTFLSRWLSREPAINIGACSSA